MRRRQQILGGRKRNLAGTIEVSRGDTGVCTVQGTGTREDGPTGVWVERLCDVEKGAQGHTPITQYYMRKQSSYSGGASQYEVSLDLASNRETYFPLSTVSVHLCFGSRSGRRGSSMFNRKHFETQQTCRRMQPVYLALDFFPKSRGVSLIAPNCAFTSQVCGIASNIFGSWVGDSTWLNHIIVNHINATVVELTGYTLDGDDIEDIGYVQVYVHCA